jgi:hypothetical protein
MITLPRPTREVVPRPTREVVPRQLMLGNFLLSIVRMRRERPRCVQRLRSGLMSRIGPGGRHCLAVCRWGRFRRA